MSVIEYSEIPADLASASDETGRLIFGAANICNHYFSLQFIIDMLPKLKNMYHIAEKKIPYWDAATQQTVTPTCINGVKLEMFVFDGEHLNF